jgi:hypothetical protein
VVVAVAGVLAVMAVVVREAAVPSSPRWSCWSPIAAVALVVVVAAHRRPQLGPGAWTSPTVAAAVVYARDRRARRARWPLDGVHSIVMMALYWTYATDSSHRSISRTSASRLAANPGTEVHTDVGENP